MDRRRRCDRDAARPARTPACRHHRARRGPGAHRVRRPGHRDGQGQAPDGPGAKGAEGHRMVIPVNVPRLVIAAPASGSGKTTVATGLMAALARRGFAVSPHKVGPDYIDPGYHTLATGRPGRNLDPWLTSEELVGPLFRHGSAGSDIAVIEGVMGLFDGVATSPGEPAAGRHGHYASTAHVARF